MRKLFCLLLLFAFVQAQAQETYQVNGTADKREGCYAFTNATIVVDANSTLQNASMVIRDGKIVAVGTTISIPADALVIDCKDKFIYPSFIDIYADYGMPQVQRGGGGGFGGPTSFNSNTKGAYAWNSALKSEVNAGNIFTVNEDKAKAMRELGFGAVLTHARDGVARGTGTVVTLASDKENMVMLKDRASAHYSFNKGSSSQTNPNSMMGYIALLRQTFLDAQWYKANNPASEGINLTLKAFNENLSLPQIFEANDKWNDLRSDRIGDEFGVQFIIKGGGNEYQRIADISNTKAAYILPLNFPMAMDVEDPNDTRFVSLADMKHWEMAPTNPAAFEKAGINFCLTTSDLKDAKQFWSNLRKAIQYGLSEKAAMNALTSNPAKLLGMDGMLGSLTAGKLANFIITNGNVFAEKTMVLHNWVQGKKYGIKDDQWMDAKGIYNLTLNGKAYLLEVKNNSSANMLSKDTLPVKLNYDGKMVKLSFAPEKKSKNNIRLSGVSNGTSWSGVGEDSAGTKYLWTAVYAKEYVPKPDTTMAKAKPAPKLGKLMYPWTGFGNEVVPTQQTLLIKNTTVWTNEKEGILQNTDVLLKNGKIVQIGKNLNDASARVIDGTGKHLTAGVIDEHSHIAAASINEGSQSVTSEVRIGDNLLPDDINIYRQLSGGVTTSHILHGSANTIGGQTQLIKLRWGVSDEQLKFAGADPFIKFALGENVKRSSSQNNNRFPDTRMGVQQVLIDAFTRASDYQKQMALAKTQNKPLSVRRDLELDALVEIMNKKRFITCHSYVATEITGMIRVADQFGFTLNTFTHILEGYKVADKMKAHGASASTFSDWWAYKMEVQDAIPYNANIMKNVGLNVAINSDDAEMARRLNQEAAKSIKYGGMNEEDALKMVTLNPAIMLHVDKQVGSIKVGKDADVVLWSDNPVSIYAKSLYTIVDGVVYFDREKDVQMRQQQAVERNRLVQKMLAEKKGGGATGPASASMEIMHSCSDHNHKHGLLVVDQD